MSVVNSADQILQMRLANQHLATQRLSDPTELVAQLGAVQAQDYAAAKWALAQRLVDATQQLPKLEEAIADGRILRTHVLRPTWHFVAPADIRWMIALTSPHIKTVITGYTRGSGLDDATVASSCDVIVRALQGGNHLTRAELGRSLREAGYAFDDGLTLGFLALRAEVEGLVCSGRPRGTQQTYALIDERVPPTPTLTRDEALAELTWRYFSSHGPALVQDCGWWSGLSLKDIRRGLEMNHSRLECRTIDGRAYWFRPDVLLSMPETVYLLPNFDEYTVAYRYRDDYYDAELNRTGNPRLDVPFRNSIVAAGRVVGWWSRTARGREVTVDSHWSIQPSRAQRKALDEAIERYVAYSLSS